MQALDPARFNGTVNGREVGLFALRSSRLQASFCNHGARLLQLAVPDRDGRWRDVVMGFDSLAQLLQGLPSMGAFIGRQANRLGQSRCVLDGREIRVPANDGAHCLHGGPGGSRHRVFEVRLHTVDRLGLAWTFRSDDDGFPGTVDLQVDYRLVSSALVIDYSAKVHDAPTPLNFTSHGFFNLEGADASNVLGHELQIDADHYVPVDAQRIPLGSVATVEGTGMDFRVPRVIGEALAQASAKGDAQVMLGAVPGFDHAFVTWRTGLDTPSWHRQARLYAPASGIAMEVWSDAPSLQFYSGAAMDGSQPLHAGKWGRVHRSAAAVCLEPQHLPDAPNHAGFGRWAYPPGETLRGRIEYRFSTDRAS